VAGTRGRAARAMGHPAARARLHALRNTGYRGRFGRVRNAGDDPAPGGGRRPSGFQPVHQCRTREHARENPCSTARWSRCGRGIPRWPKSSACSNQVEDWMAVFAYKGRSAHGELVRGTLEGADSGVIANQLFNIGTLRPIEIEPARRVKDITVKKPCAVAFRKRRKKSAAGTDPVQPPDVHAAQGGGAHHALPCGLAGIDAKHRLCRRPAGLARKPWTAVWNSASRCAAIQKYFCVLRQHGANRRDDRHARETFLRLYTHIEFEKTMRENISRRSALPDICGGGHGDCHHHRERFRYSRIRQSVCKLQYRVALLTECSSAFPASW